MSATTPTASSRQACWRQDDQSIAGSSLSCVAPPRACMRACRPCLDNFTKSNQRPYTNSPSYEADTGAEHAMPLTRESTPEQLHQRGACLPIWPGAPHSSDASSSGSGYGLTSGCPSRVQYLRTAVPQQQQQQQASKTLLTPEARSPTKCPRRPIGERVQHASLSPLLHPTPGARPRGYNMHALSQTTCSRGRPQTSSPNSNKY